MQHVMTLLLGAAKFVVGRGTFKAGSPEALFHRGICHFNEGDLDRAIADFTEAICLKPDMAAAYYNRSHAYEEKGDKDKAQQDYEKAKALGL